MLRIPRWRLSVVRPLGLVLGLFLLLGHACEVSAAADVVAHLHGSDHGPGGHAAADEASCDAVVGLRSSAGGCLDPGAVADAAVLPLAAASAPPPVALPLHLEPSARPRPLPLFLLYSALLI